VKISENAPNVLNLKAPLSPEEVLFWVLMPQGETARLAYPRMTSTTGMSWMTATSNHLLDIANPACTELWRLIALVDHHTLSPLDGFDMLKSLYGSGNATNNLISGIGTVLGSQIPTAMFNMPPFDPYRLNDLIFHYMNCKADFLRSQFQLTTAQVEQLDDFLWNTTADASRNLSNLLALSLQLKIQCTHVHGFLYVLFFHKCHPFVTPENTFELFKYLEHQKQALEQYPVLQEYQIQAIDQARCASNGAAPSTTTTTTLGAAEAAVAAAKVAVAKAQAYKEGKGSYTPYQATPTTSTETTTTVPPPITTITSLSKFGGFPKRMVFYVLTALHIGQPVSNLPEAQYQAIQNYLQQQQKEILGSFELDQKPSAKRGAEEGDHEQQQPASKQAKVMSSSDSALIAAPQNDCHEAAALSNPPPPPPPQERQSIFGGVFFEGSAATSATTTVAGASPLSHSMPTPPPAMDIMKNSASAQGGGDPPTKLDEGENLLTAKDGSNNNDDNTGNNNHHKPLAAAAPAAAKTKATALLDWFVLLVAFLIVSYLVVTSFLDWRASATSAAGPASSKLSLQEEILQLSTKPKRRLEDFFHKREVRGLVVGDNDELTTILQQQQEIPPLLSIPKPKLGLKDFLNNRDRGPDTDDSDAATTTTTTIEQPPQVHHEETPPLPDTDDLTASTTIEQPQQMQNEEIPLLPDTDDLTASTTIEQPQIQNEEIPPLPPKPKMGLEDFFNKRDRGLDNDDWKAPTTIEPQQELLGDEL